MERYIKVLTSGENEVRLDLTSNPNVLRIACQDTEDYVSLPLTRDEVVRMRDYLNQFLGDPPREPTSTVTKGSPGDESYMGFKDDAVPIPPVKQVVTDVENLRVILFIKDGFDVSQFDRGQLNQVFDDWVNGRDKATFMIGVERVELYQFPPKVTKALVVDSSQTDSCGM